jgi:hypothetical protein
MKKTAIFLFMLYIVAAVASGPAYGQVVNSKWLLPYILSFPEMQVEAVVVGDINNDGRDDVIMTAVKVVNLYREYVIMVYTQHSSGRLNNYIKYDIPSVNYYSVDIGDLNKDGRSDVVVGHDWGIAIYYQSATGDLDSPVFYTDNSTTAYKVRIGDFNNDGRNDVATISWATYDVEVFYQQSDGTMGAATVINLNGSIHKHITVGDVNNDNLDDIVITSDQGKLEHSFIIIYQNAGGGLDAPDYTPAAGTTHLFGSCAIGQLNVNQDSRNDLFLSSLEIKKVVEVYLQNAGGVLDPPVTYDINTGDYPDDYPNNPVVIADIDNDNMKDAVVSLSDNLAVYFQKTDGTLNATPEQYQVAYAGRLNSHSMTTGDLNSDGRDDIVYSNSNGGLSILYGSDGRDAVVVRSPNGHYFDVGVERYINWTSNTNVKEVELWFSSDGGLNWRVIDDGVTEPRYKWRLPYISSSQCVLRARSPGGLMGESMIFFSIMDDGVDRLMLVTPNGGEMLVADDTYTITWDKTGAVEYAKLEYSTDNGGNWTEIDDSTGNDGSYNWTVPNEVSSQCLIRLSDAMDGDPTDTSDATFSILKPGSEAITVTSPNGGEGLTPGGTHTITWTSAGVIANVIIEYSSNNGGSWTQVDAVANTGSYYWNVPNITSAQCLVRIRDASNATISDQSNSVFSIGSFGTGTITVKSPNGGEIMLAGTTYTITWSSNGAVNDVHIQYSTNGGGSWSNIVASTANSGSYMWDIPNVISTECLVKISDAVLGTPSDVSDGAFAISEVGPSLSMSSPKGGEYWQAGSQHDITWNSYGDIANVKIQFSSDNKATWSTIVASTANDGSYSWTLPNTLSNTCFIKVSDAADGSPYCYNFNAFYIITGSEGPEISLNHTDLYFGALKSSSAVTPRQTVIVNNSGYGSLQWIAVKRSDEEEADLGWLKLHDTAGTQSDTIDLSVNPYGKAPGTYTAYINVKDDNATNSPQTINVTFKVYPALSDTPPFGSMDTPVDGSTVMSSVPVTGWVVDDIGIDEVTIWRAAIPGLEGAGLVYVGEAVLVDGARPDVEAAYPGYPMNYKAGWGYMLLTNMLPKGGNGPFTLYAYAKDLAGHEVLLGSKSIVCDNAHAVKPFGAIDTPTQGGSATGGKFRNQGWVLTPLPNKIPVDGSTIKAYVDGQFIGNLGYNVYRPDIAALFPGYANSSGALAYLDFDTSGYMSGVHTIQWTATDNAGNTDGIGSRYFVTIQNSGYKNQPDSKDPGNSQGPAGKTKRFHSFAEVLKLPVKQSAPVRYKTGYRELEGSGLEIPVDKIGKHLAVAQDERIVLSLAGKNDKLLNGYLVNGARLDPLPTGSSLDTQKGKFYWQAAAGYLGSYQLVFILEDSEGGTYKQNIRVTVGPKFKKND